MYIIVHKPWILTLLVRVFFLNILYDLHFKLNFLLQFFFPKRVIKAFGVDIGKDVDFVYSDFDFSELTKYV